MINEKKKNNSSILNSLLSWNSFCIRYQTNIFFLHLISSILKWALDKCMLCLIQMEIASKKILVVFFFFLYSDEKLKGIKRIQRSRIFFLSLCYFLNSTRLRFLQYCSFTQSAIEGEMIFYSLALLLGIVHMFNMFKFFFLFSQWNSGWDFSFICKWRRQINTTKTSKQECACARLLYTQNHCQSNAHEMRSFSEYNA